MEPPHPTALWFSFGFYFMSIHVSAPFTETETYLLTRIPPASTTVSTSSVPFGLCPHAYSSMAVSVRVAWCILRCCVTVHSRHFPSRHSPHNDHSRGRRMSSRPRALTALLSQGLLSSPLSSRLPQSLSGYSPPLRSSRNRRKAPWAPTCPASPPQTPQPLLPP